MTKKCLRKIGIDKTRFAAWHDRYGQVNKHNGKTPRNFWLETWEKEAIVSFHLKHPFDGYRRLAFMMVDADVVHVCPSTVYRALKMHNLMEARNLRPSKRASKNFRPPLQESSATTVLSLLSRISRTS